MASDRHRGPHPRDRALFGDAALPALRTATAELSWLLGRGYAIDASLELVGNRHELRGRQRLAVRRAACGDGERDARAASRVDAAGLAGRPVAIDGFNCVIGVEAALSGGVLVRGRDRVLRDMSSVHGSYRTVSETVRAVELLVEVLVDGGATGARWLIDRPVSNSGRLAGLIREVAGDRLPVETELLFSPDAALTETDGAVVCTGDSAVIDRAGAWADLVDAVAARLPEPWIVDLAVD